MTILGWIELVVGMHCACTTAKSNNDIGELTKQGGLGFKVAQYSFSGVVVSGVMSFSYYWK